jgi:regulator of protease activity HflC (stomatin/prohibitin superfamily)
MAWLQDLLTRFADLFKWWFVLQPWEQALRVRAGRYVKKFEGGIHFRVPYLDAIFKQNIRLRISDIPQQTITNASNETLTIAGALRYRVEDVTPLYTHLHMAENTLAQTVQSLVADYIATHKADKCDPHTVQVVINDEIRGRFQEYGLAECQFLLTDYARVRTYRFIMGDMLKWNEHSLQTDKEDDI